MPHDFFVSHASEDKDAIARPLANELVRRRYLVWYDEFSLRLGDSLSESIDRGLRESRYGIVVLSPDFFAKAWPKRELRGLVARETNGAKVILPIWHNVTKADVLSFSPPLADGHAISTSMGLAKVVEAIERAIPHSALGEGSELTRARLLIDGGHPHAAVTEAGRLLEYFLRSLAVNSLGYGYFRKVPLKYYSINQLFNFLMRKRLLRLERGGAPLDTGFLVAVRHKASHSDKPLSADEAREYVRQVEVLVDINRDVKPSN